MSNHKRKANYQHSRSCGLCKPHKRFGNSKERVKPQYRSVKDVMEPIEDGKPAEVKIPVYVDPQAM